MTPPRPSKIIAVHLNYAGRAAQRGQVSPAPRRTSSSRRRRSPATGIRSFRPQGTELLTFEGEIAVDHRARRARRLPRARPSRTSAGTRPRTTPACTTCAGTTAARTSSSKGHDGFTPLGPPVPAADVDPARSRCARSSTARSSRTTRRPTCYSRSALLDRRPVALHDARAGRHHPHRHARRLAPGRAGRRRRGRARRASAGSQPDRRGGRADPAVRRAAARLARDARGRARRQRAAAGDAPQSAEAALRARLDGDALGADRAARRAQHVRRRACARRAPTCGCSATPTRCATCRCARTCATPTPPS